MTPPPAISCLIPWLFAPGLSFPYPSRRLITPHTPSPAPMAETRVWRMEIALLKNPILKPETQTAVFCFCCFLLSDKAQKKNKPSFLGLPYCDLVSPFSIFFGAVFWACRSFLLSISWCSDLLSFLFHMLFPRYVWFFSFMDILRGYFYTMSKG